MNAAHEHRPWRVSHVLRLTRLSVTALAGLLAGCISSEPKAAPPIPLSFQQLKQKVVELRGLPLSRDIALKTDIAEPKPAAEAIFADEYGTQPPAQLSYAYARIGLLPERVDFSAALAEFDRLRRIASYDRSTESAVVAADSARLGSAVAERNPRKAAEIAYALAVAHAIQEQRFQWQEKLKAISIEDRKLSFRALAQGDALLTALSYANETAPLDSPAEQWKRIGRIAAEIERLGAGLPDLLREKLVFPYREGGPFVSWARAARGWDGVNTLYRDPPLSSSQILHPEKYFVRRQNPLRLFSAALMRHMKESDVIEQTVGEALTQITLRPAYSREQAARIASHWTGDSLSGYHDGEHSLIAWISAWSDEKAAADFYSGYRRSLEKHRRLRFVAEAGRKSMLRAADAGEQSVVLYLMGAMVLLLDGPSMPDTIDLAEAILRETTTTVETTVLPFDSAKAGHQWASRSR